MKRTFSDNDIIPVSYAVVMVWNRGIPRIPPISQQFAQQLYDKPELTHYELNEQMLKIGEMQVLMPPKTIDGVLTYELPAVVMPNVTISSQRYVSLDRTQVRLLRNHEAIKAEISNSDPELLELMTPGQIGINFEVELFLGEGAKAADWFKNKIFQEVPPRAEIVPNEFKFTVNEGAGKLSMISIQPRVNKENLLFVSVNNHFSISPLSDFSEEAKVGALFDDCYQKFKNDIIPYLFVS